MSNDAPPENKVARLADARSKKKAAAADATELPPDHLAAVVARLNLLHAVVCVGGKVVIMTERPSQNFPGRMDRTFSKKPDFELLYANERHQVGLHANGQAKVQTSAVVWLESSMRRQYDSIIFDPARSPGGDDEARVLNLWRGWPIAREAEFLRPPNMAKWKKVRELIRDTIADGDKAVFRWVLAWMAERLKHPEKTGGVAIVLMGDEGIGKGFYAKDVMGKCYDQNHFMQISSPSHLVGRFNQHLQDALFVFADESFFAGDPSTKGQLKALITEETVLLEGKFIDAIRFPNMRSYLIASNETHVVPAGKGARRFAVLKVNESHKEDRKYFASLADELEDGGRVEMLRYLLQEDFSGINVYKPPSTEALLEQKKLSFSSTEQYWFDLLNSGQLPNVAAAASVWNEQTEMTVQTSAIIGDYLDKPYMKNAHAQSKRAAETELGITLGILIPSRKKRRRATPADGQRYCIWILPPLAQARAEWGLRYGVNYQWETT